MKVLNKKTIRRLSFRSLKASGKRNIIAAAAIALTTVLFTTLFTIAMSLNSSYETFTFRQIGGYAHGSFKDVDDSQIKEIASHDKVKAVGERDVIGTISDGVFAKVPAEISFMDKNCSKWSYIEMSEGREPKERDEIAMDTKALEILGIKPEVRAEVSITYEISDKEQNLGKRTDSFKLSGWWEYDDLLPVHFINISKSYASQVEKDVSAEGKVSFRKDLNVMLSSSINIDGNMKKIQEDLGYQDENAAEEDYVRIGVNWGYTSAQADSNIDMESILAILAFLVLVVFTGYLIIYNIFQISVSGDIRYYGLLKTIGVTPKQLRRIIRKQALMLCVLGCPVGMAVGYLSGYVLTPVVISQTTLGEASLTVSASPLIFAGAAVFSLITVLLSCAKPGRIASKVSPVEATKYTERAKTARKKRTTRGAKLHNMAFANLGRNKSKTVLVVVSLSLSVVLLSILMAFTNGFSMEKYLNEKTCADFIVGNTDYFRFRANSSKSGMNSQDIDQIKENTEISWGGEAWSLADTGSVEWITQEQFTEMSSEQTSETSKDRLNDKESRGDLVNIDIQIEGLDIPLLEKLTVLDGDLTQLSDPNKKTIAIAVHTDDYGNADDLKDYPKVGDKITVTYVENGYYIDSRTGKLSDEKTPQEYIQYHIDKGHDVEYTVAALVTVPYQMSFRSSNLYGRDAILPVDKLREDSGDDLFSLFYMFDTPDYKAEVKAESFLTNMTKGESSGLMYESKASIRDEFEGFRKMFIILGGVLCGIIGLVGILNFFNGIMTGILSRRREFAMLQSIGMTGRQLKTMLIYEGLFYALATILFSSVLTALLGPLVGNMMEKMFWFYEYHFTFMAITVTAPVFLVLGAALPVIVYKNVSKKTVVERLRES